MYARVTMADGPAEHASKSIALYKEEILPELEEHEGFKGAYLLTDPETGRGISITLWESEEAARATEQSGWYREQVKKGVEAAKLSPTFGPEYFEVTIKP